ncbi:hypothetical protein PP914_gp215 [Arthrobacter phage Qui]|uniref:Uncharacterized protein n=1 Tax=Arthrobacter phage Qui TaxID=2603260 RepID=A0A5B8WGR0_9CAUD|nr:hypothetical protein PP914_gp215 [Arthrobacter phage Qui]QED11703.1 hypothetical protein SEA_QUI_215 [Arthrobacter phage Qui]QOC56534.1 hypothetical protein SEA_PAELLA_215 [Arthrobacter phage Paella]
MITKFWCPGCDDLHMVDNKVWQVSDFIFGLTIRPSILVYERQKLINEDLPWDELLKPENKTTTPRCHSFVTDGKIEFLSDSTHKLAGQTVDIPDLPEWLKDDDGPPKENR